RKVNPAARSRTSRASSMIAGHRTPPGSSATRAASSIVLGKDSGATAQDSSLNHIEPISLCDRELEHVRPHRRLPFHLKAPERTGVVHDPEGLDPHHKSGGVS